MNLNNRKFFKIKNANRNFLCALCRAPRQIKHSKHLSRSNYFQILTLTATFMFLMFPMMGINSAIIFFILLPIFEIFNKFLYRKDIPCPYCGFDATWYRRDVKMARKKVNEFWGSAPKSDLSNLAKEPSDRPSAH